MARKDSGKKKAKNQARGERPSSHRGAAKKPRGKTDGSRSGAKSEETSWPQDTRRAVLFKPERMKYVRKIIKPEGCVFCSAVEKGSSPESLLVYKGRSAIVMLNKFPYNPGHLLVLPLRHCGDFLDLTEDELMATSKIVQYCLKSLTDLYGPSGFNVGLNLGSAAGAGIPEHLHYHVVPRWNGDTNFFPLIANTKVVVETLEQTFERLLPYFDGIDL